MYRVLLDRAGIRSVVILYSRCLYVWDEYEDGVLS